MEEKLYFYQAKVTEVYDGDTCTVDIDLGLHTWIHSEKIRLARIDAPELRGETREQGLKARDYLMQLILNKEIFIETKKDKKEKYGRYLGEIWALNDQGDYFNVNDKMVKDGYAVPYKTD